MLRDRVMAALTPPQQRTVALAHRRDVTRTHSAVALRRVLDDYLLEIIASARLQAEVQPL